MSTIGSIAIRNSGRCQGIFQGMDLPPRGGGLFDQFLNLRFVHERRLAGVLFGDLPLHVGYTVPLEEFPRLIIAAQFHGIHLPLRPFVQIDRTDEGRVHPHTPVLRRTIETKEDACAPTNQPTTTTTTTTATSTKVSEYGVSQTRDMNDKQNICERTVRDRGPSWTRGGTIEANLIGRDGLDLLELRVLIGRGDTNSTFPRGRKGPVFA